jgi:putative sigma-54 modulation protein
MDVSISARHLQITPRLEEVVQEKIGGLDRFLAELDFAEVHFDEAQNPRIGEKETCEIVVSGHGHHLRCKVNARDPYSAVDQATLKLERQIRKLRTKLQRRQHGDGATLRRIDVDETEPVGADADDDTEPLPQIVKTKRFHLGPLSADEAIEKMEMLGHGFFFFINRETNRSAVIYRRDDGDVGLIDEAG